VGTVSVPPFQAAVAELGSSRVLEPAGIDRVARMFPTLHEAMQQPLLEPSR
jgi:hypothetical protein